MASNVSKAGITTDATGASYIPSSVRADGSKRREIRVRPGYKPPEDVELYKNRAAAAWKTRGKGGVPGAEALSSGDDKSAAADATAASNKNAKRREAKRQAKEAEASAKTGSGSDNWRVPAKKDEKPTEPEKQEEPVDLEAEKEKKARNLKKKLRQARDLRDKKNQGEALLPEQLEKVIKIHELVRQLETLGFDSNGDSKDEDAQEKA
ncbi:Exon junction complex Pym [Penicillium verhagenii]|nr:Exon junction complex Pym [Penicillium verhagenii]